MTRIFLSAPDVGELERAALLRAFDSGWVAPAGPELDAFETELAAVTGWPGCVAMSSGTAALHLALQLCDVEPGDDVFVSTFTFAASANAIRYCGANPVFIDSERDSWNMSPELLEQALSAAEAGGRLPKAVVIVDLYGQCAKYDELIPICHSYGVKVIEDAAEALLATYRGQPAGTFGDYGLFSFNGNKIMTTSGGGAFVSPDTESADRVRYLSTQARQPAVHYEHTDVGYNYRLSNLLAALGRAQLDRLPQMSARRIEINGLYRSALGSRNEIEFMPVLADTGWNGWLTCVVLPDSNTRDRVMAALDEQDIESRPLWKPMHLQPVFRDADAFVDGTSQDLFERGLCLPSGSGLSDDDIDRVCHHVLAAVTARP